ncbi:MAG: 50S ribosomal protein L19 [Candidatus Peregrinibacteria bacterium]|nr:50S ribosomal protein L19 [Candidatus Peregrinibacteria bacterium]
MTLLQDVQRLAMKKKVPEIKPGYTVAVHQKIKEGEKERVQIFEGLVIAVGSGHGADKTFTVRKVVEGIGVERIFPLYSPRIEKIQVKKEGKVRRARLYYMTNRFGKSARLKETFVSENEMEKEVIALAEKVAKEEAKKAAEEGTTAEA